VTWSRPSRMVSASVATLITRPFTSSPVSAVTATRCPVLTLARMVSATVWALAVAATKSNATVAQAAGT
jgi:hypothetical protein